MKTGKKITSWLPPLLVCLLALEFSACSTSGVIPLDPRAKAPANQQVYTNPMLNVSDLTTLDPALASDPSSVAAVQMVFTGLVQLDDKLRVSPQLAQSWEESSDGTTWTFHLKTHLKFSDGTPLTAKDVAYSLDRALQPATKSTTAPIYLALLRDSDKMLAGTIQTLVNDSILVPDDNTIVLITRKKAAYFLSMLTSTCSYVVEKSLVAKYSAGLSDHLTEGGGAGPFKVAGYTHGREIGFVPNPNYYGPKPQLRKVVFPFYRQPAQAYQAYQAGRVDVTGVPVSLLANAKKRQDFHQVPQLWINYYTMNYLAKPFDNKAIRQAFALALNKTAIVKSVWKGALQATNHIIPQGMDGYNPALTGPDGTQGLAGNAAAARDLLAQGLKQEGWSSAAQIPPIKLTYAAGLAAFDQEVAAMIQAWRQVLGVTVTADPTDYNTLLDEVTAATNNANGLQFWGLAWVAEYPDPQDWLSLQFGKDVPNNNMNYGQNYGSAAAKQQLIQQQITGADANMQWDGRLQAYQQAEQALVNDVAWLPMEQVAQIFLRKAYVLGMVDNAQNLVPPDDWANIYIGQH
ncbi:MAG: peptide ABC transporter substrate-binding protein [Ktedonobacteraceae bacterium]|nr:peptide ABC transporter substrate-binding protein [Ktedonobacteraceae bacterium]